MKRKFFSMEKLTLKFTTAAFNTVFFISSLAVLICVLWHDVYQVDNAVGNWVDEAGNAFPLSDLGSYDSETGKMLPQRIYATFDISNVDTTLVFLARSCYVDVYVDDELISEDRRLKTWFFGTSPGSRWHCISLDASDEPVTLCLEVTACYENSNGYIDNMYLGATQDAYRKIVAGRLFGFIVSLFLQLFGFVMLILYFYMHKKYTVGKDLLYLGTATFFSAQWSGCETMLWQFFIGYSELFHLLSYVSLIAIPLSYGMLAYQRLNGRLKDFSKLYSLVSAVAAIVLTVLHLTGIVDFHDSLIVVHVLLVILIFLMMPLVLSYMDKQRKHNNYVIIFPLLAILMVCIAMSLVKYKIGSYGDYSDYFRIALLCFLLCLIIYQFNQILTTYSNGMKADVLADLALTDYMTGLYNRAAFNSHTAEYNHIVDSFSPLGVIQFDVNNLKTVNDTLGHEKGDMMIKAVADGLKYAFEDYSGIVRSYRTGGDEFLTIINSVDADDIYKKCIARLWQYCDSFNSQPDLGFTLVIAHGYVLIRGQKTLSEAIDEADVLMYENKRILKGIKK